MKYSITILQAEITRFENGINLRKKLLKDKQIINDDTKAGWKSQIAAYEEQITELKADIAKL